MSFYYKTIGSPVGELLLVARDKGLAGILWQKDDMLSFPDDDGKLDENHPELLEAEKQLQEYFAKLRTEFTVPLDFRGTDFQKKVWQALMMIPFGETRTYGWVAEKIGNPKAVRAVGGAANKNPIPIIAPCHRVIGTSGKLIGFGSGLENKSSLLQLESSRKAPTLW